MRLNSIWVGILLSLVILLVAACAPKPVAPPSAEKTDELYATFLGDEACQSCHESEFISHQKTRHHTTFKEATQTALGSLTPAAGEVAGGISFKIVKDRLVVAATIPGKSERQEVPLSFALGSGKTGMTYLALLKNGSAEINQSYFPTQKQWHTTPGQQAFRAGRAGRPYTESQTRHCLNCHVVTLPRATLLPEKKFYGVGCESCHGAGSRHVSLMQKAIIDKTKLRESGLFHFSGAGGKEINDLCGRCHRTIEDIQKPEGENMPSTNRFQPYGLSLSKCFINSNDTLTCITCHNPHADATTNSKSYEMVCLSCHNGTGRGTEVKKKCPVNSTEKCIECHMPTRPVFPGSPLPNQMADHFIRVYKKSKSL